MFARASALLYLKIGVTTHSSAIFNFLPRFAQDFYSAVRRHDRATVFAMMRKFVLPYIAVRSKKRGYAVSIVKAGMRAIGRPAGPVRASLTELQRGKLFENAVNPRTKATDWVTAA
jgi:5-dehydro-4-deoxyglucarate dehydratase